MRSGFHPRGFPMKRSLLALCALMLASSAMLAQHPTHPDSLAKTFPGAWEGPFTTDHGPGGTMQVVIAHDSTGVRATMSLSAHMDLPPSPLNDIKHVGE